MEFLAFAAVFAAAGSAPVAAPPALPSAVHGVWMDDTASGKAQCRRYRAIRSSKDADKVSAALVGATLISGRLIHNYSEYGEGNFLLITQLERLGRNHWRVAGPVGIDTMPDQLSNETMAGFRLQLRGNRLGNTHKSGDTAQERTDWTFRCASLPPGHSDADLIPDHPIR